MMFTVSTDLMDVLAVICMPGDFARGQRTIPPTVTLPHGFFAVGQTKHTPPTVYTVSQ